MKLLVPSSKKLIAFLQEDVCEGYSGKFLRRVLEANLCRLNGKVERFGSTQVQRGDIVELAPAWQSVLAPKKFQKFPILYEDQAIRMVDKPAGWVCSPENCANVFGREISLMHRLDKDTTGVLGLAKNKLALDFWTELFAKREVEKEYLAIVDGIPKQDQGIIENCLARKKSIQGQTIWGSSSKGLHALTHWKVVATGNNSSLLQCRPTTGRTHQIRVHLAEMGHPILVDRQYAASFRSSFFSSRPLLHALQLQGNSMCVKAPLPLDMRRAFGLLKMEVGHLSELFGVEKQDESRDQHHDRKDAEKRR